MQDWTHDWLQICLKVGGYIKETISSKPGFISHNELNLGPVYIPTDALQSLVESLPWKVEAVYSNKEGAISIWLIMVLECDIQETLSDGNKFTFVWTNSVSFDLHLSG